MYTWEIYMTNGNSYIVQSIHHNIEDFMLKTFPTVDSPHNFITLKLKNSEYWVLINLKELSEVLWMNCPK